MNATHSIRLPAEWEPQAGIQLTWPRAQGDWAHHTAEVESCFAQIAREVSKREALLIACEDGGHVRRLLEASDSDMGRVRLAEVPSDDSWARDHAPITVY